VLTRWTIGEPQPNPRHVWGRLWSAQEHLQNKTTQVG